MKVSVFWKWLPVRRRPFIIMPKNIEFREIIINHFCHPWPEKAVVDIIFFFWHEFFTRFNVTERLRIINLNGKYIGRGVSRLKCNRYQTVIEMKIYVHRIYLKIILYTLMGFFTVGSLRGKGSSRIRNYSLKMVSMTVLLLLI